MRVVFLFPVSGNFIDVSKIMALQAMFVPATACISIEAFKLGPWGNWLTVWNSFVLPFRCPCAGLRPLSRLWASYEWGGLRFPFPSNFSLKLSSQTWQASDWRCFYSSLTDGPHQQARFCKASPMVKLTKSQCGTSPMTFSWFVRFDWPFQAVEFFFLTPFLFQSSFRLKVENYVGILTILYSL